MIITRQLSQWVRLVRGLLKEYQSTTLSLYDDVTYVYDDVTYVL